MGPRPPRGAAATVAARPAQPVEVVRIRSRRPVELPSAPLPTLVSAALSAIVRDMRDVPRDCLLDRAELLFWLRRMANRVEGVGRMRVPTQAPERRQDVCVTHTVSRPSHQELAEAVFGRSSNPARAPGPRTIVGRRGQAVRVEVRRARAAGQMELGI